MTDTTLPVPAPTVELVHAEPVPSSRNPAAVYVASLGKRSRRVMRQSLEVIADIISGGQAHAESLAWHRLCFQHSTAIRTVLMERYSVATANRHLAALRGTLKAAWKLGLMSSEEYRRAADVERVKGTTLPAGRMLSDGELRALFGVCADDPRASGPRDAALLAALYAGGLRRSEAVALDIDDYDPDTGELRVRHGKGNRARVVYATNGGKAALDAWLHVRGAEPGPLFQPVNKGGTIQRRRMSDQSVLGALRRRAKQAGVASFSPHDCRRSFVGALLDAGADISTVQRLAGHASPVTTSSYDRRGEATKRKAAELLHVPYVAQRNGTGAPP
jgi:integrase